MKLKFSLRNLLAAGILLSISTIVTMVFAHGWMAPKDAADLKSPLPLNSQTVSKGKESFLDYCAACHGDNGKGLSKEDTGLNNNTPNLGKRLQTHADGDFFWKIQNGRGEMPGFKGELSEQEIWEIILHIRQTSK